MAKPGLPAPPGSAGLFHTVGKGKCLLSPAHPPKHALSARTSPPQPQPHLPIRTGQWAPESPRPGREDPGAVPRGWSPGPSLRPPGAVGALQAGPPPPVRRLELSKPHPKALPSLQYPQSKAQASPYPSSSPINGASSKRPSRTTQGQVASAWPCPALSPTPRGPPQNQCQRDVHRVGESRGRLHPPVSEITAHAPALGLSDFSINVHPTDH